MRLLLLLTACDTARSADLPALVRAEDADVGSHDLAIVVDDLTESAFSLPMPALEPAQRARFFVGNSFFNQRWVSAPSSVPSRDGLGPLFNARSCSTCHFRDGRGQPPASGEPMTTLVLRVSVPGAAPDDVPAPDPIYGDQIQGSAVAGLEGEATVRVDYDEVRGAYPDGEAYALRIPTVRIEAPRYGALSPALQRSARLPPQLIGLGLLEAVPACDVLAHADPEDADHDGISGRPSWVRALGAPDHAEPALGRFGWKAERATVLDQTAAALANDLGITSRLVPREPLGARQRAGSWDGEGDAREASDTVLDAMTLYARALAVPAPRPLPGDRAARGEALFQEAGCAACHLPTLTTGEATVPTLSRRTFHPYTDLLLHDMGPQLDDGRPTHGASGREWRTPPLWGLGLVTRVNGQAFFLHDGRARSLDEAILFHAGEAARARRAFEAMSRADRAALVAFVASR